VPDGVAASEYDFLRFRINANNREFRVLTGGVFHFTGGADRNQVFFKPVKIAARTYQFPVDKDTGGGEYGILPPGTGNVTNSGKSTPPPSSSRTPNRNTTRKSASEAGR
jgi:hypothetical protein